MPAIFGIPLTVALLSYGDTYAVGIGTDDGAITRPQLLSRYFGEAVDGNRTPRAASAQWPRSAFALEIALGRNV